MRALEVGLSLKELDLLTIGMVYDILTEKANDDAEYEEEGTQEDFDNF